MLIVKNPAPLISNAIASNSVKALLGWCVAIEAREDVLYTVEVAGDDNYPVMITYPNSPGTRPMWGGLNFHDYTDAPYWAVNT